MSIVEALLDAIHAQCKAHPGMRPIAVQLRVGALRAVVPDWLQFCFETATRNTDLEGTRLDVQTVPATARCPHCRQVFAVPDHGVQCPRCGAPHATLLTGRELELTALELEPLAAQLPA
jgi:hydrogenase nickel incorporation protein HypA/HybF